MSVRKFIFLKSELFPMSELISTESAPHDFIALAAEKRVAGETWATIARAVNRSVRVVQTWPKRFPDLWKKHYAKAEALLMKEASSEAMHTLRKLMRSVSEPVQQLAAQKILQLQESRAKPARTSGKEGADGSTIPEIRQIVDYLEGLTHEQFAEQFGPAELGVAVAETAEIAGDDPASPALAE